MGSPRGCSILWAEMWPEYGPGPVRQSSSLEMNAVRRDTTSSQSNVCPTNVSVVGDVAKKIKPEVMDTKGYVDISLDTQLEGEKKQVRSN